jgi:hypothetical protein
MDNGMIRPQDEKQEVGGTVRYMSRRWEGRQIGSNRGLGVSTGTTRGGFFSTYRTAVGAGVK